MTPSLEEHLDISQDDGATVMKKTALVVGRSSAAMPLGLAATGPSDIFKTHSSAGKPVARRWNHRISTESKSRQTSHLKSTAEYLKPGILNLCGGMPSR